MWKFVLLAIFLTGLFVFLYNQGYMIAKSYSAVTFVGSASGTGARFTSCNGYIRRIIRFKEERTHTFILDAELSKGDISVELFDTAKHRIMKLDCVNNVASVLVERNKKYALVINFISATGRYSIIRE